MQRAMLQSQQEACLGACPSQHRSIPWCRPQTTQPTCRSTGLLLSSSRLTPAVEQGYLAGRVEHVVSGQAADFQSLDTLLAFIAQVLHEERRRADHHHV